MTCSICRLGMWFAAFGVGVWVCPTCDGPLFRRLKARELGQPEPTA